MEICIQFESMPKKYLTKNPKEIGVTGAAVRRNHSIVRSTIKMKTACKVAALAAMLGSTAAFSPMMMVRPPSSCHRLPRRALGMLSARLLGSSLF